MEALPVSGFTFESQLIASSACVLAVGAIWCAWRYCTQRNGKMPYATDAGATDADDLQVSGLPYFETRLAVGLLLLVVFFASSETVRQAASSWVAPGALPVALVLGAATLIPFSFNYKFAASGREATASSVEPVLPDSATALLLMKQRRSIFPKVRDAVGLVGRSTLLRSVLPSLHLLYRIPPHELLRTTMALQFLVS